MKLLLFSDVHCDVQQCERLVKLSQSVDAVVAAGDIGLVRKGLKKTIAVLQRITKPTILVPGNSESFEELQDRAWSVVSPYVEEPAYENVVVVSHYFTTLSIVFKAIDLPLDMLVRFRMDPASITALDFGSFGPRLARFNDTSYLALNE